MHAMTTAEQTALATHADAERLTAAARQQQTHELLAQACATDDPAEREHVLERVVVLNMCVARTLAARHAGKGIPRDDLEQVAYLALTRAARNYDPANRADFLSYAVPTIRGELKKHFRDHGWTVRPPRRIQEVQTRAITERAELTQRLGRDPSLREIADAVGEDPRVVREALSADGCFQPTSLDRPVRDDSATSLGELIEGGCDDVEREAVEARVLLAPVVRRLSERDRRILRLRYFEGCTQQEIADDIGVSQMQVSRLITRIIRDIRRGLPPGFRPEA